MSWKNFIKLKVFKIIICSIIGLLVLAGVFKIGLTVGVKKAGFSYRWSENYHRNFGGPRGGFDRFFQGLGDRDFLEASGVFGQIIKIDGANLVVKGRREMEKVIVIDEKTVINRFREQIKTSGLKVDDNIVVIGEPNEAGQISAKLIRVMPPPPSRH